MRRESGVGLVEILVVLVIAGILITAGVVFAMPWLSREEMRGAVYTVQEHLQLARIQAVTRNRACQFRLNASTGLVQVIDLNDPANGTDDTEITHVTLSRSISFSDPGGGSAITLQLISGTLYQATFEADGSVSAGAGVINLLGGDRYDRVSVLGAGGTKTENWNGSVWQWGA